MLQVFWSGPYGPILDIRDTIVAGNFGDPGGSDLYSQIASSGYNLIGNSRGGSGYDDSDLLDVDANLGPLQDNGGPTLTHGLLPGSPAIDAGDNADAPPYDQRGPGFPRIVNEIIDIGAFEVQDKQASVDQNPGLSPTTVDAIPARAVDLQVSADLPSSVASFSSVARTITTQQLVGGCTARPKLSEAPVGALDHVWTTQQHIVTGTWSDWDEGNAPLSAAPFQQSSWPALA
jgi:hypothetical protein